MSFITDWHMTWVDWGLVLILVSWLFVEIADRVYFKPRERQRIKTIDEHIEFLDQIEDVMVQLHEPLTDEMLEFLADVENFHMEFRKHRYKVDPLVVWNLKVSMQTVRNQLRLTENSNDHAVA